MAKPVFFSGAQDKNRYEGIVFDTVADIAKTTDLQSYARKVEILLSLMVVYVDEEFKNELRRTKIKPDLSNPYYNQLAPYEKQDYADKLFRAIVKLVHRSGFDMPIRKVEGILDEEVIDELMRID